MVVMEPDDLARLIERHAAALTLYARQWCAAAEDVVQESFIKLARQAIGPDHVAAWLYRVTRNGAISAGRSERRRRAHEHRAAPSRMWFQPGGEFDGDEATDALQALPLEIREAVVAHLWGGLTFAQIADVSGCSKSTAHRRYDEGMRCLRERLGVACPRNET